MSENNDIPATITFIIDDESLNEFTAGANSHDYAFSINLTDDNTVELFAEDSFTTKSIAANDFDEFNYIVISVSEKREIDFREKDTANEDHTMQVRFHDLYDSLLVLEDSNGTMNAAEWKTVYMLQSEAWSKMPESKYVPGTTAPTHSFLSANLEREISIRGKGLLFRRWGPCSSKL